jgi:RimJ/RimL family protein N-acetyltransferase
VALPDLPIRTERLALRPFEPEDHAALLALHEREDVTRYLPFGARDAEAVREVLARKMAATGLEVLARKMAATGLDQEGGALELAAILSEDGRLVGDVSLFHRSTTHRAAEVGYVFDPSFHGRGLATEATAALLEIAFDQVGYHRVYGRLDARNRSSARVLEKVGMRREAHLVENEWLKGEWTDEVIYAVLDREWAARRCSGSLIPAPGSRRAARGPRARGA